MSVTKSLAVVVQMRLNEVSFISEHLLREWDILAGHQVAEGDVRLVLIRQVETQRPPVARLSSRLAALSKVIELRRCSENAVALRWLGLGSRSR